MDDRLITKEHIKIQKGKNFLPSEWFHSSNFSKIQPSKKVVVFDLDETLGSFADLYILWCGIRQTWYDCDNFYELLELYPEFLRYGILTILEYLYHCKMKKTCEKIFVYTNNQCSVTWVKMICNAIEKRIRNMYPESNTSLFDQYICAFKINNKPIEPCRTSHKKRLDDFFRCTMISHKADICFIDDVEYPYMKGSMVYYICPRAYIHTLNTKTIVKRILSAKWIPSKYSLLHTEDYWRNWFIINKRRMVRRGNPDITIDLQISKKMIYHLSEFLHYDKRNKQPDSPIKMKNHKLKRSHKKGQKKKNKSIRQKNHISVSVD